MAASTESTETKRWAKETTREDAQVFVETLLNALIDTIRFMPSRIVNDDSEASKFLAGSVTTSSNFLRRVAANYLEEDHKAYAFISDTLREFVKGVLDSYRRNPQHEFRLPDRTVLEMLAVIKPAPIKGRK